MRVAIAVSFSRYSLLNILGTLDAVFKSAKAYGYTCENFTRDKLVLPVVKLTTRPKFFSAAEVGHVLGRLADPARRISRIPRCGQHASGRSEATPATVQAELGHSDPRFALSAYTHVVSKSKRCNDWLKF
jgi:hypothetical protein